MADPKLPITGHCLCGKVRYELSAPPVAALYCHCKRCQRRTGTAFSVSALTAPGSFRIVEGEELLGSFEPEDGWHKFFCGECGGHLFTKNPKDPEMLSVRMGSLDEDPGTRPAAHQFVAYAAQWVPMPDDGLPRFDERIPQNLVEDQLETQHPPG